MTERNTTSMHGQWSSGLVFVLAAAGSAVGLGNLWRFPYLVGENGGAAFIIIYLICIALVGFPIMVAEIAIGRHGRASPINSLRRMARSEARSEGWSLLGWLGVGAGFLILSFYSVVGGWSLYYSAQAVVGRFTDISAEGAESVFNGLVASPVAVLFWHTAFMLIMFAIVAAGVRRGLERAVKFLMPLLLVLLVVLVVYGTTTSGFAEATAFLVTPDFSALQPGSLLAALGQAFFTLSLGMGAIMVYGAYLPGRSSVPGTSVWIVGMDTVTALLAGLAIFPIVFTAGLEAAEGPGLVFVTLPVVFADISYGWAVGSAFFILLTVAAVTSGISLLEPAVAWLTETRLNSRIKATGFIAAAVWALGIACGLSLNHWAEITLLGDMGIMDSVEYVSSNLMLPLGGMLIALFLGWQVRSETLADEFACSKDNPLLRFWQFLLRYVAPAAVALVLLEATGLLDWATG